MSIRFLKLVEVELLRNNADIRFGSREILIDVDVEHRHLAASLRDQRTDNADSGGFTGTVGAQQGKKITLLNLQADTFQRLKTVVVDFGEIFNGQCWYHGSPETRGAETSAPL